jgi:glucosamine kinase
MLQANTPLYYIGIDGGGTKCRARLKNRAGKILGEGLGGASNIRLGLVTVWQNIMVAVDEALAQAQLPTPICRISTLAWDWLALPPR